MIRILFSLLLINYFTQTIYAQKNMGIKAVSIPEASCTSVDNLSVYIKENFATDTSRILAIYDWITNHISYDVLRMQEVKNNPQNEPQTLADVLKSRSAVCQGYADLFTALCKNLGINALVVGGYAKTNGKVMDMAHAWVAAQLKGEWFLFDPTWGAGYLNNNQFVKRFLMNFTNSLRKILFLAICHLIPFINFFLTPSATRNL